MHTCTTSNRRLAHITYIHTCIHSNIHTHSYIRVYMLHHIRLHVHVRLWNCVDASSDAKFITCNFIMQQRHAANTYVSRGFYLEFHVNKLDQGSQTPPDHVLCPLSETSIEHYRMGRDRDGHFDSMITDRHGPWPGLSQCVPGSGIP
jgi:hypothetical protein